MAGRASFIELSRRALAGDEDALISLRTEDADVPDEDLLRRAQNRINRLDQQEARVPIEKPQPSIKAYHGSPYQFEQFDIEKIGTGEGAQAYGYGLYFAESEDVARGYKEALTNPRIEVDGKPADLIYTADIRERFSDLYDEVGDEISQERLDIILSNMSQANTESDLENVLSSFRREERQLFENYIRPRSEFVEPEGALYEVQIQTGQDELINWDRPVREQPPRIRDALLKLEGVDENTKGEFAYYRLAPQATGKEAQKQATDRARELGIKGIKYADGFSRKTEGGTSNFVIFDSRIIDISKQYGISIPLAGALLANTEQAQAQNLDDINVNEIPQFWEPEFFQDNLDPQVLEAREQANSESGPYAQLMAEKKAREVEKETWTLLAQ
jgi:hypothetical protein